MQSSLVAKTAVPGVDAICYKSNNRFFRVEWRALVRPAFFVGLTILALGPFATLAAVYAMGADKDAVGDIKEIVISATRQREVPPGDQLQGAVEQRLAQDPYFYSAHVWVSVENGVATLHGIVFDEWDLRFALRITRHVPGV